MCYCLENLSNEDWSLNLLLVKWNSFICWSRQMNLVLARLVISSSFDRNVWTDFSGCGLAKSSNIVCYCVLARPNPEMEEDYDRGEQQQETDLERESRPDLWQLLPCDLADKVLFEVWAHLPFSSLFRFCCVSKRWRDLLRDFLRSTHSILYFHADSSSCIVFNPRRGLWESMSLQFCAAEGFRIQDAQQVSCGEGLLHLSSALDDEFVVCNPLTRRYKRFSGPSRRQLYGNKFGTLGIADTTWRIAFLQRYESSLASSDNVLLAKVVVYLATGYFHFSVLRIYSKNSSQFKLLVKDSRLNSRWETISDAPRDFWFIVEPTLFSKERILLGFGACPGGFKVLAYDVGLDICVWIPNVDCIHQLPNATSSRGIILVANVGVDGELEFFEMRNTDAKSQLTRSRFPPLTNGPRRNSISLSDDNIDATTVRGVSFVAQKVFNIVRLGDGDLVHYVGVLKQSGPGSGQVEIAVWTRNQRKKSDFFSNREAWGPSGLTSDTLMPLGSKFSIFKPSLESPG